jgi:hypothetical protein
MVEKHILLDLAHQTNLSTFRSAKETKMWILETIQIGGRTQDFETTTTQGTGKTVWSLAR